MFEFRGISDGFQTPTRRQFLNGIAGLGASAMVQRSLVAQAMRSGPVAAAGWIDVHHHFSPPTYADVTAQKKVAPAIMNGWSVQKTIDDMDQASVSTAMNSIVVPGVWFGDKDQARRLARECNEYAAKLSADYPKRFGSFATLPVPDMEGSLLEIEYAMDMLKADGFMLFTSYGDKWLGDPFFAPVLEELNRRSAVVFVHPTTNACCSILLPGISSAEIEYGTDTTRAIVRMVYSGAAKMYPNIRLIFSHGGGTMPYLIGRFVNRTARPQGSGGERQAHDFQAEIGKFYYDTAQTFHPVPMTALRNVVPISQILFGTDYSYRSSLESTSGLIASKVFNPAELEAIKRENALRILPRWKTEDGSGAHPSR
ncbi:MAG: amidohydrolase [Acidobacteriota bacterium]|nr:amidohydrolase [Acidobacteriota bacterium]